MLLGAREGALAAVFTAACCILSTACGGADPPPEVNGHTSSAQSATDCAISADDPASFDQAGTIEDDGSILVPDGTNTSDGYSCRGGNWVTTPADLGSCLLDPTDASLIGPNVGVQMNDGTIVVPNGTETSDGFACNGGDWVADVGSCLDGTSVVPNGTETVDDYLCLDGSWYDEDA